MYLPQKASLLSVAVVLATLGGCSSDDQPYQEPDTPTPTPAPEPAVEFPVQAATPAVFNIDASGSVLTTENSLSLYIFDNDEPGESSCNGVEGDSAGSTTDPESCAGRWPPLLASDGAESDGYFSLIERSDGTQQWAYKESPLYTFSGDVSAGDTLGDGIGDVWHLARPAPIITTSIAELQTYVGNQVVRSASASNGEVEEFRVDKDGFSLYLFDNDPVNDAACYSLGDGACINNWPPLLADVGAKTAYPLSILNLENGIAQYAYKGKPLYFFSGDTEAGQTNGDGIGDVWHLATQVPAIQRGEEGDRVLSATGLARVLSTDEDGAVIAEQQDKDGFTLYTFDNDEPETSNCTGGCAEAWPPFLASQNDIANGAFTMFLRDDGQLQWAWNEHPIYFFSGDNEPGDRNGDGINGVWHSVPQPAVDEPAPEPEPNPEPEPQPASVTMAESDIGEVLLGSDATRTDMQLYTFENDSPGVSNCAGGCATAWPPFLAADADVVAAPFSLIERADGNMQWAINGKPLYYFGGDTEAGQQNGEGSADVWFVARPAPLRVFEHDSKGVMLVATQSVLTSQGKTAEQLNQLTLYTFDDDVIGSGESTCFGGCAVTWPPLYANSLTDAFGEYDVIVRVEDDGSETFQWTYRGQPLYFFISDTQLGDTGGDYPTWQIARP